MEESYLIHGMLGDSHRYKTDKGEISLIYPSMHNFNSYEIYCIEGNLFDDTESYDTLAEAKDRIKGLLLWKIF